MGRRRGWGKPMPPNGRIRLVDIWWVFLRPLELRRQERVATQMRRVARRAAR